MIFSFLLRLAEYKFHDQQLPNNANRSDYIQYLESDINIRKALNLMLVDRRQQLGYRR